MAGNTVSIAFSLLLAQHNDKRPFLIIGTFSGVIGAIFCGPSILFSLKNTPHHIGCGLFILGATRGLIGSLAIGESISGAI